MILFAKSLCISATRCREKRRTCRFPGYVPPLMQIFDISTKISSRHRPQLLLLVDSQLSKHPSKAFFLSLDSKPLQQEPLSLIISTPTRRIICNHTHQSRLPSPSRHFRLNLLFRVQRLGRGSRCYERRCWRGVRRRGF
jgi:hypothetical protein